MQEILQQIGQLLLGSIPTLILFILLVVAYQVLVQGPLSQTLHERRARTAGAVEEAHKAIAAAEAKAADYATRLRQARAEVFKVREQRLKQRSQERDSQLEAVRTAGSERVTQAKEALQAEAATAREALQAGAGQLADQVVRAVMPATAGGMR